MRILYGIFAQGHGHFSKAAILVPLLQARGHEVRLVSSGQVDPPKGYSFPWHRHLPGLSYVVTNGRTDYVRSCAKWLRESPAVLRNVFRVRQLVREFRPDLILSDFEPLTASPLLEAPCEVVSLSRQVALFDRSLPVPEELGFERRLTRSVIRLFTMGATRLYGYHYRPASFRCVPPVLRPEIRSLVPTCGEHVFAYNQLHTADGGSGTDLVAWAARTGCPVRAYGYHDMPRGRHGLVEFLPEHRTKLLEDMASSRAVMTTAGLSTPLEAFLLKKPTCTVPIPGHFEQLVNACHLDEAGIATWCRRWDYDRLFETAAPTESHPLWGWLSTPADRVLSHVLNDGGAAHGADPAAEVPSQSAPARAA